MIVRIGAPNRDGDSTDGRLPVARCPTTATRTYQGHLGRRTCEWAVDSFVSFDPSSRLGGC